MKVIHIETHNEKELVNITSRISSAIKSYQWQNGVLVIFVPHTTASIIINECVDPYVKRDFLFKIQELIPRKDSYRHAEGNSDSHIMAILTHTSQSFIVENGEVQLGSWQGVFLAEYDGPRQRKIWLKWLPA
ncbi:MAG: secondary thiamine-phosphate synthase enzyme YjbQ [Caldisericia bacterium]|nr:secondary thiamine-phosphate synthase enzyme YjbQ [Caldisericia bacterium]